MQELIQAAGGLVVLLVVQDVFFTVLFPGSGRGVLRRPLTRFTWHVFRVVGERLRNRKRRRDFLAYSGPVQIAVNLGGWIVLLVIGWAMVFQPALGSGVVDSNDPGNRSWATAVYYSGYTVTTLGFGDVSARTGLYKLLTVAEVIIGFATLSMAVTYFLSVYSALTERKVTAARLHHRTYDTGDAAALLAGMSRDGEIPGAPDEFGELAEFLQRVLETHAAYPVLRYFHQRDVCYTLPRLLLVALDGVTLVEALLDPAHNRDLRRSPSVWSLRSAAESLLGELISMDRARPPDATEEAQWRARCAGAADRLAQHGLRLRPDAAAAAEDYVKLRAAWNEPLRALTRAMLYDWVEVDTGRSGR